MRAFYWLFLFSIFVSLAGRAGVTETEEARKEFLLTLSDKLRVAYDLIKMDIDALPHDNSERGEAIKNLNELLCIWDSVSSLIKQYHRHQENSRLSELEESIQVMEEIFAPSQAGTSYFHNVLLLARNQPVPAIDEMVAKEKTYAPEIRATHDGKQTKIYLIVPEGQAINQAYGDLVARFFTAKGFEVVLHDRFDKDKSDRILGEDSEIYASFVIILHTSDSSSDSTSAGAMDFVNHRMMEYNCKNTIFTLKLSTDKLPSFLMGTDFAFDNIYQREQVLNEILFRMMNDGKSAPIAQYSEVAPSFVPQNSIPPESVARKEKELVELRIWSVALQSRWMDWSSVEQNRATVKEFEKIITSDTDKLWEALQEGDLSRAQAISISMKTKLLHLLGEEHPNLPYREKKLRKCLGTPAQYEQGDLNIRYRVYKGIEQLVDAHGGEMAGLPHHHVALFHQAPDVLSRLKVAWLKSDLEKFGCTVTVFDGNVELDPANYKTLTSDNSFTHAIILNSSMEQEFFGEINNFIRRFRSQKMPVVSFAIASPNRSAFERMRRGQDYLGPVDQIDVLRIVLYVLYTPAQFATFFKDNVKKIRIPEDQVWSLSEIATVLPLPQLPMVNQPQEMPPQIKPDADPAADDEKLCIICMARDRDAVSIPCGHMGICFECVPNLKEQICPFCRGVVQQFVKVYRP